MRWLNRGGSTSWGLAVAVGAVAFVASYAAQRLGSAWVGEADWTQILRQAHVPYYWRCALAAFHAVLVVAVTGLWVGEERAARWLAVAPLWVPAVVVPAAFAMAAVP